MTCFSLIKLLLDCTLSILCCLSFHHCLFIALLPYRFGSYLLLSAITCVALGWVTGETTVAQVADEKQLQQLRAEADVRRQELVKVRGAAAPAVAATAASQPHATDEQVTGTAAAAGTTGMDISSSLPFQPITLVFRDLRYVQLC